MSAINVAALVRVRVKQLNAELELAAEQGISFKMRFDRGPGPIRVLVNEEYHPRGAHRYAV